MKKSIIKLLSVLGLTEKRSNELIVKAVNKIGCVQTFEDLKKTYKSVAETKGEETYMGILAENAKRDFENYQKNYN